MSVLPVLKSSFSMMAARKSIFVGGPQILERDSNMPIPFIAAARDLAWFMTFAMSGS